MKKLLIIIFLLCTQAATAMEDTLVRLAIGEYGPFTSANDSKGKMLEHVVIEAFKLEGIKVKFDYFPWVRSYLYVKTGEYDGTFPWKKSESREKEFYIHDTPLFKDESVYFYLKNTRVDSKEIGNLKNYRIGVTPGHKVHEMHVKHDNKIISAPSETLNFKKILAGEIDLYRSSKFSGQYLINNIFNPEQVNHFTYHPEITEVIEYFILFSKETANGLLFAQKFNSGLKKLKASGAYDKLITVEFVK